MNVIRHSRSELLEMQNFELSKTRPSYLSIDFTSDGGLFMPDRWLQHHLYGDSGAAGHFNNRRRRSTNSQKADIFFTNTSRSNSHTDPEVIRPQRSGFSFFKRNSLSSKPLEKSFHGNADSRPDTYKIPVFHDFNSQVLAKKKEKEFLLEEAPLAMTKSSSSSSFDSCFDSFPPQVHLKQKAYDKTDDDPKQRLVLGSGDHVGRSPLAKDETVEENNNEEADDGNDNEEEVGAYLHYFNLINENISKLLAKFSL